MPSGTRLAESYQDSCFLHDTNMFAKQGISQSTGPLTLRQVRAVCTQREPTGRVIIVIGGAFCRHTRKRFEPTHGDVFEPTHGFFRAPSRATHRQHTHHTAHATHTTHTHHRHHTPATNTTHNDTAQHTTTPKHKTHIPHTLNTYTTLTLNTHSQPFQHTRTTHDTYTYTYTHIHTHHLHTTHITHHTHECLDTCTIDNRP